MAEASTMSDTIRWSITLIGIAVAIASGVGVFLPTGQRFAVLLPLLAGLGIGIAGLAIGSPDLSEPHADTAYEQLFFESTVAGFITVIAGLVVLWLRAQRISAQEPGVGLPPDRV
jgi:hypothetical protein